MADSTERELVRAWTIEHWGAAYVITRGKRYEVDTLPGFWAENQAGNIGIITYRIERLECEIVTLNSRRERIGVGTTLIAAVQAAARSAGCRRLWLITTNDNTAALRFYQKRGFRLRAVYIDAIANSRRLKPEIPRFGNDGIEIRDEIELDMEINP